MRWNPCKLRKMLLQKDTAFDQTTWTLNSTIQPTFQAANEQCLFITNLLFQMRNQDRLPKLAYSMFIERFKYTCWCMWAKLNTFHTGFRKNVMIRFPMRYWVIISGQNINPNTTYDIIYRERHNKLIDVRLWELNSAEAVKIKLFKPFSNTPCVPAIPSTAPDWLLRITFEWFGRINWSHAWINWFYKCLAFKSYTMYVIRFVTHIRTKSLSICVENIC